MAGHSKWKNIRIRKGKQDAIRGKQFTKISREIIVAAKAGGGDPGMNPRLRVAVYKARSRGFMPGSPPLAFATTMISRLSLVNCLPRIASCFPLRIRMFFHLEWPAMPYFGTGREPLALAFDM